jgi:hypothetical protein
MTEILMAKADRENLNKGAKTYAVVDSKTNGVCQMFATEDQAKDSADLRNVRAHKWGLQVRYRHENLAA